MATFFSRVRLIVGALVLLGLAAIVAPATAQQVNPTASAVKEEQLLLQLQQVQGRVSIPDAKSGVLIQPAGQAWRQFHEVTLYWTATAAVVGTLVLLVLFYMIRGQIKIRGGRSGKTITRFNGFERFAHWLTALSFVVLALSGLNLTFGKKILLPLIGPLGFHIVSDLGKTVHNYLSFAFAIGLFLIFIIWLRDNIPGKIDIDWFKAGGGIVGSTHPPSKRFNGGQKVIYWIVVLGGTAVAVSGYLLMFPFYVTDIAGMQLAQMVHGIVAVLLIAAMLAHIYIGTVGMEGASEAMSTGEVDLAWAREHHDLWVAEQEAKAKMPPMAPGAAATPAE